MVPTKCVAVNCGILQNQGDAGLMAGEVQSVFLCQ